MFKSICLVTVVLFLISSCNAKKTQKNSKVFATTQEQLIEILKRDDLVTEVRYALVNKIATNMLAMDELDLLILFLTVWVDSHPEDPYNAYWLLMSAHAYLKKEAKPVAEYYFERIIKNYGDLILQGHSIHRLCLQNLIKISTNPANRINYLKQLISRFPNDLNVTELYFRMAKEYEAEGEWTQALLAYNTFLERDDSFSIQITGYPDAYLQARQIIDFSNSSKDWTFETLDALVTAVKQGISNYDYRALDKCKSKVNFFAMSWKQDELDTNAQEEFSMRSFMRGNKIRYNTQLDSSSTSTYAYLRTTGWSNYVNVWYFYFRKVNFPADPEIHGRWEWAGIYFGEKI